MAGLTGFELPEDDSSNSHQLPENGPTTLGGLHANSAGISVRWTKRHVEVRILSHPSHAVGLNWNAQK
jgi:hypothetical protein